ncbi:NADH-quinone oxidoreductase subunit C [Streptomyces sp. NBC_01383]|uniref:NADH-quinone oxidoreductase subunit C n=1 Tax=Streptomyces sp. NBC_01383 TaxID=2903846 RepID=UPI003244E42F
MTAAASYDRLPDAVTEIFGEDATAEQAYDLLTVDVPPASWIAALETARDGLGCTYFDWLSAVDEPGTGFQVCAHLAALPDRSGPGPAVRRLLVRTTVPHEAAVLPSAIGVFAGAAWHERETHEMFGIGFDGHPHLVPLLLPEGFEGHPLRKDFVLAARVAKAWPGAKEPGESEHGGPKRRTMLPPGVPDPNEWGPLKGQLPPAPARPTRTARPAGDRPARRTRSASDGSAGQQPVVAPTTGADGAGGVDAGAAGTEPTRRTGPPRRTRTASQGSASQQPPVGGATGGDATGAGAASDTAAGGEAPSGPAPTADAPWHNARPAFDDSPDPDAGPSDTAAPPTPEPPAEQPAEQPSGQPSGHPSGQPSDAADTPEAPKAPRTPETPEPPAGGDTE